MNAAAFDWQSWLACGLGVLAVLHLTRRWWPQRRHHPTAEAHLTPGSGAGCAVEAPSACGGGGCGSCGTSTTPIRVHRKPSGDNLGSTPGL